MFQTQADVLYYLHALDQELCHPHRIEICGRAALLLHGYMPAPTEVIRVWKCLDIEVFQKGQPQLDFTAMRQVGLLYDYEDRLIRVEHGFTHLHLYTTSIQDWVVSALHGEDFDFVFTCSLVTGEVLDWVADNMDKYCGMRPFADKTLERLLDGIK